jgi:hypothetical protein
MTIENLKRQVAAPDAPFEAFEGPWEPIEAELRTPLPQDYKDFVRLYGSGYFMEFLGIYAPRTSNPNTRFERNAPLISRMFLEAAEEDDEELTYPFWPTPSGLIAFGATDNGDMLFWRAQGHPDTWRVVIWDRGLQTFEALDCDLTDFLAGLATGDIQPEAFPGDLLVCDHLFQPHTEGAGEE